MTKAILAIVLIVALTAPVSAQEAKPTVDVRLDYLLSIEATTTTRVPVGQRLIVNVTGGTVRGPNIKGDIQPPAGDWLMPMPDGSNRLDVRFTVKTDDNEFILVEYGGISALTKEAIDRFAKGERVTAEQGYGYFITAPRFTTTSAKYSWLNHIQAVGKMVYLQRGVGIKYDVFAVR
jgi:uncharacterized protein DUF3237